MKKEKRNSKNRYANASDILGKMQCKLYFFFILISLNPQYSIPEGKILKTKQVLLFLNF